MLRLAVVFAFGAFVGCAGARTSRPEELTPGVVVPVHLAEGHGDGALAESVPSGEPAPTSAPASSGAASAGSPARAFTADQPDPQPLRLADQFEYTLYYEDAKIRLVALRRVHFPKPVVTARRMGRYAFELWIGHELVDRVRFDFPLLAASEAPDTTRHKLYETPALTGGPYTVTVLVPAAPRARSARLVDRATRLQAKLSWPPEPTAGLEITPLDPASKAPEAETASAVPASSATPASNVVPASSAPGASSASPASSVMPAPLPPRPAASTTPAAPPSATSKSPIPPAPPTRPRPPPPHELERP